MPLDPKITVARCIDRLRNGDASAEGELLPLVYDELRAVAARLLVGQAGHTLQATALVHEAWLKLARGEQADGGWEGRSHFLAVAAKAMRQILVNHARDRRAHKRGGDAMRVTLHEGIGAVEFDAVEVLALDEALARLAQLDARQAKVVELRAFGGLALEEVAAALGIGLTTVKSDWRFARAWLHRELPSGGRE